MSASFNGSVPSAIRSQLADVSRASGGSNVLLYYGSRKLCHEDVQQFKDATRGMDGQKGLAFIINTLGGDTSAAKAIIRQMQDQFSNVTAIVPFIAASAGTLMALCCHRLVIGKIAELTSTDPMVYPRMQAKDVLIAHDGPESVRGISARSVIAGIYPRVRADYVEIRKVQAEFLMKAGRSREQAERILAFFYDDVHKAHNDPILHSDIQHLPLDLALLEDSAELSEAAKRAVGSVKDFLRANPGATQTCYGFDAF